MSCRTGIFILLIEGISLFGRWDIMAVLGITERPATTLIGRMHELEITERITGDGKGKY